MMMRWLWRSVQLYMLNNRLLQLLGQSVWSTSMANRPTLSPYQADFQDKKNDLDVQLSVNQRLGSLELALASLTKTVSEASAKQGTDKVSLEVLISNILAANAELLKKYAARLDEVEKSSKEKHDMQDY